MPNWTSNLLRVSGPRLYRSIFADSMYRAGHERGLDGVAFTYAEVLPMPEILRGTTSPLPRTEEQLRADAAAYGWSKETLDSALQYCLTQEDKERYEEIGRQTGFLNWYDWACAVWGVKWDACESEFLGDSPRGLLYRFNSPWCAPTPVVDAFAFKYPSLKFTLSFIHEGEKRRHRHIGNPGAAALAIATNEQRKYKPMDELAVTLF